MLLFTQSQWVELSLIGNRATRVTQMAAKLLSEDQFGWCEEYSRNSKKNDEKQQLKSEKLEYSNLLEFISKVKINFYL